MFDPTTLALLAQLDDNGGAAAAGGGLVLLLEIALLVVVLVGMWKVYEKAGKPGWAAIIPIYNLIVLLEIVGRPLWWIILFLIPCVQIIPTIVVSIDLARKFGKGAAYAVGLILLPFIFYPMLGFGDARYNAAA